MSQEQNKLWCMWARNTFKFVLWSERNSVHTAFDGRKFCCGQKVWLISIREKLGPDKQVWIIEVRLSQQWQQRIKAPVYQVYATKRCRRSHTDKTCLGGFLSWRRLHSKIVDKCAPMGNGILFLTIFNHPSKYLCQMQLQIIKINCRKRLTTI